MTALSTERKRTIALGNLTVAQDRRLARARLHREVIAMSRIAGCYRVAELLLDIPRELETLPVIELLCWIRLVGTSQARGILRTTGVRNERRRLGGMTERQRDAIAVHLTTAASRRV